MTAQHKPDDAKPDAKGEFKSAANDDELSGGQKFWQAARPILGAIGAGVMIVLVAGGTALARSKGIKFGPK